MTVADTTSDDRALTAVACPQSAPEATGRPSVAALTISSSPPTLHTKKRRVEQVDRERNHRTDQRKRAFKNGRHKAPSGPFGVSPPPSSPPSPSSSITHRIRDRPVTRSQTAVLTDSGKIVASAHTRRLRPHAAGRYPPQLSGGVHQDQFLSSTPSPSRTTSPTAGRSLSSPTSPAHSPYRGSLPFPRSTPPHTLDDYHSHPAPPAPARFPAPYTLPSPAATEVHKAQTAVYQRRELSYRPGWHPSVPPVPSPQFSLQSRIDYRVRPFPEQRKMRQYGNNPLPSGADYPITYSASISHLGGCHAQMACDSLAPTVYGGRIPAPALGVYSFASWPAGTGEYSGAHTAHGYRLDQSGPWRSHQGSYYPAIPNLASQHRVAYTPPPDKPLMLASAPMPGASRPHLDVLTTAKGDRTIGNGEWANAWAAEHLFGSAAGGNASLFPPTPGKQPDAASYAVMPMAP